MKKYFITSDIHSYFTQFLNSLNKSGFDLENPEHILIILGDLFDRGPETRQLYDYLISVPEERLILIRGNHEDLLYQIFYKKFEFEDFDQSNGTLKTVSDFTGMIPSDNYWEANEIFETSEYIRVKEKMMPLLNLIKKEIDYLELGNYIFVHGWIPSIERMSGKNIYDPNWRNASKSEWMMARWDNGMQLASKGVLEPGKTIVCGHWHTSWGNVRQNNPGLTDRGYRDLEFVLDENRNNFRPYYADGIIALDACTAYTGRVNILVLDEDQLKIERK